MPQYAPDSARLFDNYLRQDTSKIGPPSLDDSAESISVGRLRPVRDLAAERVEPVRPLSFRRRSSRMCLVRPRESLNTTNAT